MKTTVIKIPVDIEFESGDIVASANSSLADLPADAPDFLLSLATRLVDVLISAGFSRSIGSDTHVSKLHGGYSIYLSYIWKDEQSTIKLFLDMRVSNHKAKPSFAESSSRRERIARLETDTLKKQYKHKDDIDVSIQDIVDIEHDWGAQIFIGNSSGKYSEPITSIDAAVAIFEKKISKILEKYS